MVYVWREENIKYYHGEVWITGDVTPTRAHQAEEDYLELERILGASLRFQRDREGRYL